MIPKFIDAYGVRTRYYDEGEGSAVVLISGGDPGTSSDADSWQVNIPALAGRHRVIAMDRIGTGFTGDPETDDGYRMEHLRNHLVALLRELSVRDAAVVGHSRGGLLAAAIAREAPDLVARLVIVNSATLAPAYGARHLPVEENLLGGSENVRHDAMWYAVQHDQITDAWVSRISERLASPERQLTQERMARYWDTYLSSIDELKADVLGWLRAGSLTCPSAVLWGIGDPSLTPRDALDVFDLLVAGGAPVRLHAWSHCGHSPFAEFPDEFNRVMLDFLDRPAPRPGLPSAGERIA